MGLQRRLQLVGGVPGDEPLERLTHPTVLASIHRLLHRGPGALAGGHLGPLEELVGDAEREHEALVGGVVPAALVVPAAEGRLGVAADAGLLERLAAGGLVHGFVELPPALGEHHAVPLLRRDHQHLHLAAAAHPVRDATHHDAAPGARVPLQLPPLPRHQHGHRIFDCWRERVGLSLGLELVM